MEQDLPPKSATVKAAGIEVIVDKNDTWETIGMIVVLVLVVYAGIRAINYGFDRIKNRDNIWK